MYASVLSLRSDRYHYKLQESAKNMCSSTKMPSASGDFAPPDLPPGALPHGPPLGAPHPDPRYRLALPRSPYQPAPNTSNYFRRPCSYALPVNRQSTSVSGNTYSISTSTPSSPAERYNETELDWETDYLTQLCYSPLSVRVYRPHNGSA